MKALYIMGSTISMQSLFEHSQDHAGVAVFDGKKWILADPTAFEIINYDWDINSQLYEDVYWIGHKGAWQDFCVRSPEKLREFDKETLAKVPRELLNEKLGKFEVCADASMKEPGGKDNEKVIEVRTLLDKIYSCNHLNPSNTVPLKIFRSQNKYPHLLYTGKELELFISEDPLLPWQLLEKLDESYNQEVAKVKGLLEHKDYLTRFEFEIDDSMKRLDGGYVNPNLQRFIELTNELTELANIPAKRAAKIKVYKGKDNYSWHLEHSGGEWKFFVDACSDMSWNLMYYLENEYHNLSQR